MQLLLAPAINWTNLTKYQCILENSVIIFESCTWEFVLVCYVIWSLSMSRFTKLYHIH